MKAEDSMGRRSSSVNAKKERHYVISSSSSSSSRSRSSSRSSGRSRSPKSRRGHRHKHSRKRRHSGSRHRSRSHTPPVPGYEKKASGYYGTNSTDPKMVASRLFLGNLPYDITKDDIRAIYSKYGKIIGLTLLKGYGFIQYESESVAQAAVKGERGSSLKGFSLDVKLATEGRASGRNEGDPSWQYPPFGYRPPLPRPLPPGAPMPGPPVPGPPVPGPPMPGPPFGPPMPFLHRPLPPPDHFRRHSMMEPFPREPLPDFRPFPPHPPPPAAGAAPTSPPGPPPPAVDCRILILTGKLRTYAEGIQKRLMAAGIVTELILVADSEVMMAVEDATKHRMLFAVVVTEQNEIHRSITVNILHGLAQEHRNMPVDDAITLITRSFDKYMLDRRERTDGAPARPHGDGQSLQPSARIQYLLNLLADQRHVSAVELTLVIDYLVERRRKMDSSGDIATRSDGAGDEDVRRHAVTTGRIMDVDERRPAITSPLQTAAPRRDEMPNATSSNSSLANVINNPSVKQALDNLISSGPNILKNISDTLAQKSAAAKYGDPSSRS